MAAWRAGPVLAHFLFNLLAFALGLSALGDLWLLLGLSAAGGAAGSDAQAMAAITVVPAVVWAALWAGSAAALLGWALWRTWGARSGQG